MKRISEKYKKSEIFIVISDTFIGKISTIIFENYGTQFSVLHLNLKKKTYLEKLLKSVDFSTVESNAKKSRQEVFGCLVQSSSFSMLVGSCWQVTTTVFLIA
jgi:hypothetical protein